ncbi:unnamed protein product [Plutella xylostella]|uniref:(diamondback moth) hypothetical protein n=1 Tax=Plutella xylostella TaxID=51655 RepID=A0A8S4G5E7_PLUXY|nr:unnamed protein product [Plutella xylostella]
MSLCAEASITAEQLGDEALALGLALVEADTWAAAAPSGLARQLGDRETKRQEHIYELILTEKHHCLTIRLMQKMFAEGMMRAGGVTASQIGRMFPCLHELWALHSTLLTRLRNRQKCSPHIASIADILADTFSHPSAEKFKQAYGRMFPCLHELWALHSTLLTRLRNRQKCSLHIASIADILADTFSHPSAEKFKQAYGRMFPCLHELWALHSTLLTRLMNRQKCSPHIASIADILADTFSHPSAEKFKQAYVNHLFKERFGIQ